MHSVCSESISSSLSCVGTVVTACFAVRNGECRLKNSEPESVDDSAGGALAGAPGLLPRRKRRQPGYLTGRAVGGLCSSLHRRSREPAPKRNLAGAFRWLSR